MSSDRNFTVRCFIFGSTIHFELLSVSGVRYVTNFIFFQMNAIFPFNFLCTFVKSQLIIYAGIYFWTLYSVPLIYSAVILPKPYFLDYYDFMAKSSSWVV